MYIVAEFPEFPLPYISNNPWQYNKRNRTEEKENATQ
jgi:hypothetical protein